MIHIGISYPCTLLATGHTAFKIFGYHFCASFIATNKTSTTLDIGLASNMRISGIKTHIRGLKIHFSIG